MRATYSRGLLHMDEQRQDDLLEPTYNWSVPIRDVTLKTYRKRRAIEKSGVRGLGKAVLVAWQDDGDDDILFHFVDFNISCIIWLSIWGWLFSNLLYSFTVSGVFTQLLLHCLNILCFIINCVQFKCYTFISLYNSSNLFFDIIFSLPVQLWPFRQHLQ